MKEFIRVFNMRQNKSALVNTTCIAGITVSEGWEGNTKVYYCRVEYKQNVPESISSVYTSLSTSSFVNKDDAEKIFKEFCENLS